MQVWKLYCQRELGLKNDKIRNYRQYYMENLYRLEQNTYKIGIMGKYGSGSKQLTEFITFKLT